MQYIFLILITIGVSQWRQLSLQLASISKKSGIKVVYDPKITKIVKEKAGLDIKTFKVLESDKYFGMMIGFPLKHQLILSSSLYKDFNSKELEYILMHEAGHYIRQHTLREGLYTLVFILGGAFVLSTINDPFTSFFVAIGLGVVSGLILIQFAKWHEYEAEYFAIEHTKDPKGMIDATNMFRKNWKGGANRLIRVVFYRSVPFEERIKIASSVKIKE